MKKEANTDCAVDSQKTKGMECCSRICDLVTTSLLPYIEPKCCQLTKETEKDMLLSLSMISRKIKQWASEDGYQSEKDLAEKNVSDHHCSQSSDLPFKGDHNCLANVVTVMVSYLNIDSRFVQHTAGNILSSLSSFLTKYVNKWIEFIHMLLISLEAAISSICSSASLSSPVESVILIDGSLVHCYPLTTDESFQTEDPCFDSFGFTALLQARLEKVNWLIVEVLFWILHRILKYLKCENGDLEGLFMNLVVASLIKMPWDLFSGINGSQSLAVQVNSGNIDLPDRNNGLSGIKGVLLGTILRLLCSLVEQNDPQDEEDVPLGDLSIHFKFINLVPQLLHSCFSKCLGHEDTSLSQYLRHKMLILMNRLSFHSQWRFFHPASWLKLLGCYFEDLIFKPVSEFNSGYDDFRSCLEGSPFLASFSDGDTCTRHLQRLAIFQLFKCCFTLVHWKQSRLGCPCATQSLSFTSGLQLCCETCCHIGILELSKWFYVLQKSTQCETCLKSCGSFGLSFLQLFMEEDDMLFEMLLLLSDAPIFALQEQSNAIGIFQEERDLHYITNVFHPAHMFHWFLLLLHYDHLVLVDYLISKDTGVQCVKYLLRCLRIICKCWCLFVEFSTCGSETNQKYYKKRKISIDDNCGRKLEILHASTEVKGQYSNKKTTATTHESVGQHSYENAKECLLSLKRSVADLHQKSLFPYNPRPLLRSLTRFEELCAQ